MADMLLFNGIVWDHQSFPYMVGDWWFSYLAVYMLIFSPMFQTIAHSSISVIWTMFTISFMIVIPSAVFEWMEGECMSFFTLIQFLPSFLFGQALAVWFVRTCMQEKAYSTAPDAPATSLVHVMRPHHDIPVPVRFGVTIGVLVMGLLSFSFSPYDVVPLIKKPITPIVLKGGLIPIQGLMVAGLACEMDPIARLFARTPFRWGGKLALSMIVFQTPVYNAVYSTTGRGGLTWTYSFALLFASMLGYFLIEKPWRKALGLREK
jgi:hypothetical protein